MNALAKLALLVVFTLGLLSVTRAQAPPAAQSITFDRADQIDGGLRLINMTLMVNGVTVKADTADVRGQQIAMGQGMVTVPAEVPLQELIRQAAVGGRYDRLREWLEKRQTPNTRFK